MGNQEALFLALSIVGAMGFMTPEFIGDKEHYLADAFLRDVVERMGAELNEAGPSYVELPAIDRRLAMMARGKDLETEQLDYDSLIDGNPNPSIRDQEYVQHSSLWGHLDVSGGAGEGNQRLRPSGALPNKQLSKTDAVLPAYCNPPNPCPVGYTEEQGCLTHFENTAAFSRDYQAAQNCMCDGEHMWMCPAELDDEETRDRYKNLISKKHAKAENPFLTGERLPVAAKKGVDVKFTEY